MPFCRLLRFRTGAAQFVKTRAPVGEFSLFDGFAHFFHDYLIKMQVVDGIELCAQDFAGAVQVVQVGAAEMLAGVAAAACVQRRGVVFVLGVFDFHVAKAGKQPAVAGVARGHHAVEHIHAMRHAVDQIFRRTHAHQVMRLVRGQHRANSAQHAVHLGLGFANTQTADGQPRKVKFFQPAQRLFAQVFIHRALHDAEERVGVVQIFKRLFRALRPAQTHLQRCFGLRACGFAGRAFVKLHGDVGIQHSLDFHRDFGRQE